MEHKPIRIQIRSRYNTKNALILYGGEGHQPLAVSEILSELLKKEKFSVQMSNTLDILLDSHLMKHLDLIVFTWTRGTIKKQQLNSLLRAIKGGTGFVGIHASVGAFRSELKYHEMIGGQFLSHPGGDNVTYKVSIIDRLHPTMKGMNDFTVKTEKYYMLIDPAIHITAATCFGSVLMPVVWTKNYGKGRVFYNALGHSLDIVKQLEVLQMMKNGMVWAAK
ncbi:ThuA domain-containing protein [Gracilibacillus sp. YIM 98692]|uniref:ThuA domain-containing protein n=1 Tax=Gracilibacillus sp. YIM 98692 TaxID=2663532 RepID=UPI001F097924|nr:ThuA domain-containing protein [Gracilibacillus sp. YIM 98692]